MEHLTTFLKLNQVCIGLSKCVYLQGHQGSIGPLGPPGPKGEKVHTHHTFYRLYNITHVAKQTLTPISGDTP